MRRLSSWFLSVVCVVSCVAALLQAAPLGTVTSTASTRPTVDLGAMMLLGAGLIALAAAIRRGYRRLAGTPSQGAA